VFELGRPRLKRDTGGAAFDNTPLAWCKAGSASDCFLRSVCPYRCLPWRLVACHAWAQSSHIAVLPPEPRALGFLTRPYRQRIVPPINLANSSRLAALIRAGNLYLTAQDAIALALENNIDIETQRYGPLLFREDLRRAQVGGNLRVPSTPIAAGPQSVSLAGVNVGSTSLSSGSRRQLERGNHGVVRVRHPQFGSVSFDVRQPGPLHLSGEQPDCGPNQLPGGRAAIDQPRLRASSSCREPSSPPRTAPRGTPPTVPAAC